MSRIVSKSSSLALLSMLLLHLSFLLTCSPAGSADRLRGEGGGLKGIGGMGGGVKGVGGMGGGFKGIGGMGGGVKGVGGMGGGFRGVGDAGGGFSSVEERYRQHKGGRYLNSSSCYQPSTTRYGTSLGRYGEPIDESGDVTRYGVTTGRWGEPVGGSESNTRYGGSTGRYGEPTGQYDNESAAARSARRQEYTGIMHQMADVRANGASCATQNYGGGSVFGRLRSLEANPPSSFNHIYLPR